MRLTSILSLAVAGVFGATLLAAQDAPKKPAGTAAGQWTGWITDTHCGKNGADKNHSVECVEKCMKGGSKPQLWVDADAKAYNLDSFDKAKPFVGQKVLVKGNLDAASSTITVESVAKAPAK